MPATSPKIAIVFSGTRGDQQPYIAAGYALRAKGFDVVLAGGEDFAPMAAKLDLNYISYLPSAQGAWSSLDIVAAMTANDIPNIVRLADEFDKEHMTKGLSALYQGLKEFQPDIILGGLLSFHDLLFMSKQLDCAALLLVLQATLPSNDVAVFGILPKMPYWTGLNMFLWRMLHEKVWDDPAKKDVALKRRMEVYGLNEEEASQSVWEYWEYQAGPKMKEPSPCLPLLIGSSVTLNSPLPRDFTPNHIMLGPLTLPSEAQKGEQFGEGELQAVQDFINAGPPPVYVGYGSVSCHSSKWMTLFSLRALKLIDERAIVCSGWGGMSLDHVAGEKDEEELKAYVEKKILFVKACSHDLIFPQCKVIVHHGGAGTFNASLRSGSPTVIAPVMVDQFCHTTFVNELGVGVGLKQMAKSVPEDLAAAITKCITSADIQTKAKETAEKLKAENGCAKLADFLNQYYREEVVTGKHRAKAKEVTESVKKDLAKKTPERSWFSCLERSPKSKSCGGKDTGGDRAVVQGHKFVNVEAKLES
jgi:sterol 3beta-glucosyltransferase